jgi:hypothetical protein
MNPFNELELPVGTIEDALIQCAIPGYWGEVRFEVEILPAAVLGVQLRRVRRTTTTKDLVSDNGPITPSDQRVDKVRSKMPDLREKFRLHCPVKEIRAVFKDGNLVQFDVTDVERVPPPRSRARASSPAG